MHNIIRLKDGDCALCAFRTDKEAINIYLKWMNLSDNTLLFLGQNTSVINYKDEQDYVNKTDSSHIRFVPF